MSKLTVIKELLSNYIPYHIIVIPDTIDKIYKLFTESNCKENDYGNSSNESDSEQYTSEDISEDERLIPRTPTEYYYFGVYYAHLLNNQSMKNMDKELVRLKTNKAIIYLAEAIKYDIVEAMVVLGYMYNISNTIAPMIKFYNMAIKRNHPQAMNNMGQFYKNMLDSKSLNFEIREKYIKLMVNYFKMAIELKHSDAMNNLAYYYEDIVRSTKDMKKRKKYTKLMLKYYIMSVDHGNGDAMFNLANYFKYISDITNMKKYLLMGSELDNYYCIEDLLGYYAYIDDKNNINKYKKRLESL